MRGLTLQQGYHHPNYFLSAHGRTFVGDGLVIGANSLGNLHGIPVECTRQAHCHCIAPRNPKPVTPRAAQLLIAIASVMFRNAGDFATADIIAFVYLGVATMNLHRSNDLRAAVRDVRAVAFAAQSPAPRS